MDEQKIKINIYTPKKSEDNVAGEHISAAGDDYVGRQQTDVGLEKTIAPSVWRRLIFVFWLVFLMVFIGGIFAALVYKTNFTFSKIKFASSELQPGLLPVHQLLPENDENRENILLLGYRGPDDPNGGLLTDTLMILSVEKSTDRVAMISIPRDLFIQIPGTKINEKINYAYAYGQEQRGGQGVLYIKAAIAQVTGLFIDNVVLVNFNAFSDLVDALGGINIYLKEPFVENIQFSKEIIIDLPVGENHLNGQTALYYIRSRYTTSDFDRAKRQQRVLLAIKDKATSLGVLANPIKVFALLDALGKNVKTDLGVGDIKNLLVLYGRLDFDTLQTKVFDTTPQGLLYADQSDTGAYILLPVGGNFDQIKAACQNIFTTK